MKRLFLTALSCVIMLSVFTSCNPEEVENPDPNSKPDTTATTTKPWESLDPATETYTRKNLIEHFTGMTCGYCPGGVKYISEAIANEKDNYIWVSHHAGFANDAYTIAASTSIVSNFGVSGAPNMMLNRTSATVDGKNALVYHPFYLSSTMTNVATTADASVRILNNYDAATKVLTIDVYGAFKDVATTSATLSVLVTESGLHNTQTDYENTFEGWADYVHNNAARVYLSAAMGDAVEVSNGVYHKTYTTTFSDEWNASNSAVIAFLTNGTQPVLNAEWAAIVSGTQGGRDIASGGVTRVPVGEFYPEADNATTHNITYANAGYYVAGTLGGSTVMGVQATPSALLNGSVPFAMLYFFVDSSLTNGTYQLLSTGAAGTAWAGYCDHTNIDKGGSQFILANYAYFQQGYLYPDAEWMLASGTITISDEGLSYSATSLNGSTLTGTFTGTLANYGTTGAPAQKMQAKNPIGKIAPMPILCK